MSTTAKYPIPFTWNKYTSSARDAFNQAVDTYPSQGTLWGSLEDQSSNRGHNFGGPQTSKSATVRLRQFPAVSPKDYLVNSRTGVTYHVDSLYQDWAANETVCVCECRGQGGQD